MNGPAGSTDPTDARLAADHANDPGEDGAPPYPYADDASTDRFKLTYYSPPEGLEREILALFSLEWDEDIIEDRHAGALGQLFIILRGTGTLWLKDREEPLNAGSVFFSGFDEAAPFRLEGPWHCVGVSLSPFGWAALVKQPASAFANRILPAGELLGAEFDDFRQDLTRRCLADELTRERACFELAEWIRPRLSAIPPLHESVVEKTLAWLGSSLNPSVDELFAVQNYSRRQVERIVLRYFGFTPSALARKYRAIRAANLLSQANLSDEAEAEVASAFYDQPHMIREIRRYCGYTPTRLGGEGDPLFQQLLRMKNLDRQKGFRSIG